MTWLSSFRDLVISEFPHLPAGGYQQNPRSASFAELLFEQYGVAGFGLRPTGYEVFASSSLQNHMKRTDDLCLLPFSDCT